MTSPHMSPSLPPSLYYLTELGLDYELQNASLLEGNTNLFNNVGPHTLTDFLRTFNASCEPSLTKRCSKNGGKVSSKDKKNLVFSHIVLPTTEAACNIILPSHRCANACLHSLGENATTSIEPPSNGLAPGRVDLGNLTTPLLTPSSLVINSPPSSLKRHKTVHSAVEELQQLFKLPQELNKLDSLNLFLHLIHSGKIKFSL